MNLFSNPSGGKSARQLEFESHYTDYGIDFREIQGEAVERTQELVDCIPEEYMTPAFWASNLTRITVGLMRERYPQLMFQDEKNRWYFKKDRSVRLYFKTLNERSFTPSNISTRHVAALNCGMGLLYGQQITALYLCYKPAANKDFRNGEGYLLEMQNLKKPLWISNLTELSAGFGDNTSTTAPAPIMPTLPVAPNTIRLDPRKSEQDLPGRTAEQ